MLDKIFLQVLNMSFTASYVIILVLFARLLLKKVPKIFSYALWSIVFFRLVCPFSFESNLSWFHLTGRTIEQMRPFPEKFTTLNNALPTANATIELSPIAETSMSFVSGIFTLLWLVGIVALLLYSAASLFRLRHKLIGAVKLRDNIYLADHIQSPFVIGVMRPKIYLPSTLSEREQGYIILHEQTHIKRFDHIVKILAFCTLCVHWFNPLVWLAFILCVKDMEMSCDESVMKQMHTDIRNEYSASLLSLATGKKMIAGTPLAFGEGDTTSRIKNVLNYKKPAFWVIAVSMAAVLAAGIGLMSNPKDSTNAHFGSSAKDILSRYTLALAASDIAAMRQLTPALNPPPQDVMETWRQIKVGNIEILHEDIRENKAAFELSVTVKEAPDGFGMWTPGTATHYLYVEKCDRGWYVESYGAGGRSQSDMDAWWSQSNLIGAGTSFPENFIMLAAGEWPDNEYTKHIPKPENGAVLRGWIDPDKQYCYIQFSDINQAESEAYTDKLEERGFNEVAMTSEEIKNAGYTSVGALYANDDTYVSITYTDNMFGIFISHTNKADSKLK